MTAMTSPTRHGFSPARAAAGTAVSGATTAGYLAACSRVTQTGCTMIGPQACHNFGMYGPVSTTQELVLLTIGMIIGAAAGLATYLFLGQPHVTSFICRAAAVSARALTMLVPTLACAYFLRIPLAHHVPGPAAVTAALALSAVFVYAIRRTIITARSRGAA